MSFYHPGPEFRRGRRSDVNWKPGMDEGRPGEIGRASCRERV